MERSNIHRGLAALLLIVGCSNPCGAVTDEEIFRDFRFNFINPGARSLGMGGSFIAIANDATAAQANPAGLTNQLEAQLFVEARYSQNDSTSTARSRIFEPTGSGFIISTATDPGTRVSPSFISYVYSRGNLRFGVSRQEVLNIRSTTNNTTEFRIDADNIDERGGRGEIDLLLVHWNASLALQLHESFRLGATASYGRMTLQSSLVNTYELKAPQSSGLVDVPIELFSTESDGSDDDLSFTLGLLWKPFSRIGVGGVYRHGGDFFIDQRLTAQALSADNPDTAIPSTITSRVFFNESGKELTARQESFSFQNEFHVPDTIGVGLSWQSAGRALTLSTDLVRVAWSDLLEGFNSRLNVLTIGWESEAEAAFTVDDQTNLHAGLEYDWRRDNRGTWSFRAGYHTNKDNRIRADFPDGEFGFGLGNNENFAEAGDEDHFSVGAGVIINDRLQLDLAGDASRATFEVVGSLIYFFGAGE